MFNIKSFLIDLLGAASLFAALFVTLSILT
jgi:hypothetical protein